MSLIIGYQVINTENFQRWNGKKPNEILTEKTAIENIKEARQKGLSGWVISAVLLGDIESPVYEHSLMATDDQYKVIGLSTAHLTDEDKELLTHLAQRDDYSMVLERETGFFVKLHQDTEAYEYDNPFSESLFGIMMSCLQAGFTMIEFDRDATSMEEFALFE